MPKERHYEVVKSGGKEYVYEYKEPESLAEAIGNLITGPTRVLREVRTIEYKNDKEG
jgi:predicted transcriptional regulator